MHWEAKYPEPKRPRPFDNRDLFTCLLFALVYTNAIMNFYWVTIIMLEICFAIYCANRKLEK